MSELESDSERESVPASFTPQDIDLETWACIKHLLDTEEVKPSTADSQQSYSTVINRINEIGPSLLDTVYKAMQTK